MSATPSPFEPGSEWTELTGIRLVQMVCEAPVKRPDAAPLVLGERDVPDERLCPPGYTEVSAVCTHPVHQRRGLGEAVLRDVASAIQARGQTPMLHVEAESAALLDFYARLGFRARREVVLTILQKSEG